MWSFEAENDLRVVTVEGVSAIDPQQTTIPDAWKKLPTYPMKLGDTLRLVEKRRGDADPPPNQLTLARSLWLDFDGAGFTASDVITGTMTRDWRLVMAAPTTLGRVSVSGKDQFITHLADPSQTGVEIRQGRLVVNADSRIATGSSDIPAVGWAHDFHQVSGTLHVPPGWRVVHATGVDTVSGTWVRHWSLLEIFLALIVAVAVGRLFGVGWGGVALATLVLTLPESGAPKWGWLVVLALEALVRALKDGRVKTAVSWARAGAIAIVAILMVPFLVTHVREGVSPVLAPHTTSAATAVDLPASQGALGGGEYEAKAPDDGVSASASSAVDQLANQAPNIPNNEPAETPPPAGPTSKPRASSPSQGWSGKSGASYDFRASNAQVYDPTAAVQTGPGLPRWSWSTLRLTWSGPVTSGQRMHLYLLSPNENLALALLRALLLVALLARLAPWKLHLPPRGPTAAVAAAIVLTLLPGVAHADIPDGTMLDDLRDRLTKPPTCSPSCTSTSRLALDVHGGVLRIRVDVEAAARAAVPLPGGGAPVGPTSDVAVDGKSATALARMADGVLWIEVAAGVHQIALTGPMPDRETLQLSLHDKPHRVEASVDGWTVEGIHEDGLADDDLQLSRARKGGAVDSASLQPGVLPPFVLVERTLEIGLNWQVATRVVRVTPPGSAIVLEVPLLAGESVTTADVRVVAGKALVNMGPTVVETSWRSSLPGKRSPVKLSASKSLAWFEVWSVDVGPIWHATYAGIPFVHAAAIDQIPTWRPWPGEEATVTLVRPEGVEGQTLTIDESRAQISPGLRATDVVLTLTARSSRGSQHTITLPPDAQLESLTVNGAAQPIRQDGRRVVVGVVPGAQTIALAWREPRGISFRFDTSAIDLGTPSVNTTIAIAVPAGRWLLFAGGPRLGPAILFWSEFLILLVVAAALGRIAWTPLRTWHWMLLAVGLSQSGVIGSAFFVASSLAAFEVAARLLPRRVDACRALRRSADRARRLDARRVRDPRRVHVPGAARLTGHAGAWQRLDQARPSSCGFRRRITAQLPAAWMVSVPVWVYRAVMLAWALWAAFALLRGWIRIEVGIIAHGGRAAGSIRRRLAHTPLRRRHPRRRRHPTRSSSPSARKQAAKKRSLLNVSSALVGRARGQPLSSGLRAAARPKYQSGSPARCARGALSTRAGCRSRRRRTGRSPP